MIRRSGAAPCGNHDANTPFSGDKLPCMHRIQEQTMNAFILPAAALCFSAVLPATDNAKILSTPFSAGDNGYHSYRIPALAIARNGDMLAFAEGRIDTWKDKSRTHIILRRSNDGGKTWLPAQIIAQHGTDAYMDPCPVIDAKSGNIYLFTVRWPQYAPTAEKNRLILLSSRDHGRTWQEKDMTAALLTEDRRLVGFGPGSGIRIAQGAHKGRLLVPSRQQLPDGKTKDFMIYSDDGGKNWKTGNPAPAGGEGQIAEGPSGEIYLNLRASGKRRSTVSSDGGTTWSPLRDEPQLAAPDKGCHASVLGRNGTLLFCGPAGTEPTGNTDNRGKLMLYASGDSGKTWSSPVVLASGAAGYSCMAPLPDGKIVVLFETADGASFMRSPQRPAGWMRLDLLVTKPPRADSTKPDSGASQRKK